MVPSVKCLPCKHRNPSLDPQHPHTCQVSVSAALSRQEPQSLLASQSSFRYLKPEEEPMLTSGFYTHIHTHTSIHTQTRADPCLWSLLSHVASLFPLNVAPTGYHRSHIVQPDMVFQEAEQTRLPDPKLHSSKHFNIQNISNIQLNEMFFFINLPASSIYL